MTQRLRKPKSNALRGSKTPEQWWATSIIEMRPGVIRYRGYAIGCNWAGWLRRNGLVADARRIADFRSGRLLEAALVAAVDHGPQAPSIAIARMAITCGVGINNAMASAINVLGDVHGGAGEQCVQLLQQDREPP